MRREGEVIMRRFRGSIVTVAIVSAAVSAVISISVTRTAGQASRPARTADGKPNFSGIWQALNEANWDLQAHDARPGMVTQQGVYPYDYARVPAAPVLALGAAGGVPGSIGVVQGDGQTPYTPEAGKMKQENGEHWIDRDPELKCYLPGIPRAMYMPYPFEIVQSTNKIQMAYEFTSTARTIHLDKVEPPPDDTYMGHSVGRWEGDTLVVDVSRFNGKNWFDRAGNWDGGSGTGRRDFMKRGGGGVGAATIPAVGCGTPSGTTNEAPAPGAGRRILLRGGVVLSLDPRVGDFEKADVLIDGKKIAEVAPTVSAGDAEIVDCMGTIVMPGFIHTHHHQYETLQRSIIPDGLLRGEWPQESYGSVVQNIWTAGRIADPANPNNVIWDLGRAPYDPEDCYISELVACLSEISEGLTTGTDTSQSSHTPEHTDAMIKGLMDSGRRMVYAYTGGINRSSDGIPYEFPGAMNDTAKGIGRIAKTYFSSRDQLVTLGFGGGPGPAAPGADYTGWQLARAFGASIHNHNVGGPNVVIVAAADARNGTA